MFTTENANSAHVAPALEEHPADPIVESIVLATAGGGAGDGAMRWVTHRGKMHRLNVLVLTVAETGGFGADLSERALAAERTAAERTAEEIARKAPSAEVDWRVDIGTRARGSQPRQHKKTWSSSAAIGPDHWRACWVRPSL
jgi:hypothetical protein